MKSIRSRLLYWLMVPLSLIAMIVAVETFLTSQKTSNDLHDKTLLAASLAIYENIIASNGTLLAEETLDALTNSLGEQYFYHVSGPNQAFVAGYSGYPRLPETINLKENEPYYYDGVHLGNQVRVVAFRRLLSGRQLNGQTTVTTWQRVTQRKNLTLELFARSLVRLFLLVLSAGLIVWFAISKGLKPLVELQQAIDVRTPFDLTPIKREMAHELSAIVSSMNSLFNRVALSKSNRERFIGDAAHQLRNPIAAIKTQAETALISNKKEDQKLGLEAIIKTSNQTSQLVSQMLSSASAFAMDADSGSLLDLNDIVAEVARDMAPSAIEKGQDLSFAFESDEHFITGKAVLLREAVLNLIDNAIKYSPANSHISIQISNSEDNKYSQISIIDEGEPISPEKFNELTQPFASGDDQNSGSGLGLSVAKDIARSHGGWVQLQSDGHGKEIMIVLPNANSGAS